MGSRWKSFRRQKHMELREDLCTEELAQQLRAVEDSLQSSASQNAVRKDLLRVADFVTSKFMFTYPDKSVQLIGASIIVELFRHLRFHKPNPFTSDIDDDDCLSLEAFFTDSNKLAAIFRFLCGQLTSSLKPESTLYRRFIRLLEPHQQLRSNPAIVAGENHFLCQVLDVLIQWLLLFLSNGSHSSELLNVQPHNEGYETSETTKQKICCAGANIGKIFSFALVAVPSLVSEIDHLPDDIVELLLLHLLELNEKKIGPVTKFCCVLFKSAAEVFQAHINTYLLSALQKSNSQLKADEKNQIQSHAYNLIPVLWSFSPSLVASTLGVLERKLRAGDTIERSQAASAVAAILNHERGFNLITEHSTLWRTFTHCCEDPEADIRRICVKTLGNVVMMHFDCVSNDNLDVRLLKKSLDCDFNVRREAVAAVANLLISSDSNNASLVKCIEERTRDIKLGVREAAISGLGRMFSMYWQQKRLRRDTSWVNAVLRVYCSTLTNERVLVEETFSKHMLSHCLNTDERMDRLLWLWTNSDQQSARCLEEIFRTRNAVRSLLRPALELLKQGVLPGSSKMSGLDVHLELGNGEVCGQHQLKSDLVQLAIRKLKQLSLLIAGGNNGDVKVHRFLWILVKLSSKDKSLLTALCDLTDASCVCQQAQLYLEVVRNKLSQGNPNLFDGLSNFVDRLSPLIDDALVEALVCRVELASLSQGQDSEEDTTSCMNLLLMLSRLYGGCFKHQAILSSLVHILQHCQEDVIIDGVLRLIMVSGVGFFVKETDNSHRSLIKVFVHWAINGSRKLTKHAVICISVLFGNAAISVYGHLNKQLIPLLRLDSPKVVTALVALGHMIERCPKLADKEIDLAKLESFVVGALKNFHHLTSGRETPTAETFAKMQGLKMLMRCAVTLNVTTPQFTSRVLTLLCATVTRSYRNISDSISDVGHIGLQAGCCILRLARIPACYAALTLDGIYCLSLLISCPIIEVHCKLIRKLHRGLITMHIPFSFACLLCLAALWDDGHSPLPGDLTTDDVRQMFIANVIKRRQLLSIKSYDDCTVTAILPEYVIPFAVHLLARRLPASNDVEGLYAVSRCLQVLIGALTDKHHFNLRFYSRIFDMIRQSKDATNTKSSEVNLKLHLVCEMARSILMSVPPARSLTSIDFCPAQVFLPEKLICDFKPDRKIRKIDIPADILRSITSSRPRSKKRLNTVTSTLEPPLKKRKMESSLAAKASSVLKVDELNATKLNKSSVKKQLKNGSQVPSVEKESKRNSSRKVTGKVNPLDGESYVIPTSMDFQLNEGRSVTMESRGSPRTSGSGSKRSTGKSCQNLKQCDETLRTPSSIQGRSRRLDNRSKNISSDLDTGKMDVNVPAAKNNNEKVECSNSHAVVSDQSGVISPSTSVQISFGDALVASDCDEPSNLNLSLMSSCSYVDLYEGEDDGKSQNEAFVTCNNSSLTKPSPEHVPARKGDIKTTLDDTVCNESLQMAVHDEILPCAPPHSITKNTFGEAKRNVSSHELAAQTDAHHTDRVPVGSKQLVNAVHSFKRLTSETPVNKGDRTSKPNHRKHRLSKRSASKRDVLGRRSKIVSRRRASDESDLEGSSLDYADLSNEIAAERSLSAGGLESQQVQLTGGLQSSRQSSEAEESRSCDEDTIPFDGPVEVCSIVTALDDSWCGSGNKTSASQFDATTEDSNSSFQLRSQKKSSNRCPSASFTSRRGSHKLSDSRMHEDSNGRCNKSPYNSPSYVSDFVQDPVARRRTKNVTNDAVMRTTFDSNSPHDNVEVLPTCKFMSFECGEANLPVSSDTSTNSNTSSAGGHPVTPFKVANEIEAEHQVSAAPKSRRPLSGSCDTPKRITSQIELCLEKVSASGKATRNERKLKRSVGKPAGFTRSSFRKDKVAVVCQHKESVEKCMNCDSTLQLIMHNVEREEPSRADVEGSSVLEQTLDVKKKKRNHKLLRTNVKKLGDSASPAEASRKVFKSAITECALDIENSVSVRYQEEDPCIKLPVSTEGTLEPFAESAKNPSELIGKFASGKSERRTKRVQRCKEMNEFLCEISSPEKVPESSMADFGNITSEQNIEVRLCEKNDAVRNEVSIADINSLDSIGNYASIEVPFIMISAQKERIICQNTELDDQSCKENPNTSQKSCEINTNGNKMLKKNPENTSECAVPDDENMARRQKTKLGEGEVSEKRNRLRKMLSVKRLDDTDVHPQCNSMVTDAGSFLAHSEVSMPNVESSLSKLPKSDPSSSKRCKNAYRSNITSTSCVDVLNTSTGQEDHVLATHLNGSETAVNSQMNTFQIHPKASVPEENAVVTSFGSVPCFDVSNNTSARQSKEHEQILANYLNNRLTKGSSEINRIQKPSKISESVEHAFVTKSRMNLTEPGSVCKGRYQSTEAAPLVNQNEMSASTILPILSRPERELEISDSIGNAEIVSRRKILERMLQSNTTIDSAIPTGQLELLSEEYRNSHRSAEKDSVVCRAADVDRLKNVSASSSLHVVSCAEARVMTTEATSETKIFEIDSISKKKPTLHIDSKSSKNRSDGISAKNRSDGISAKNRSDGISAKNRSDGISAKNRSDGISAKNRSDGISAKNRSDGISAKNRSDGISAKNRSDGISAKKKVKSSTAICYETQPGGNCDVPGPINSTETDEIGKWRSGACESVCHFYAEPDKVGDNSTFTAGQLDLEVSQSSSKAGRNSQQTVRKVSVACQSAAIVQMHNASASTSLHEISCCEAQVVSKEATTRNKEILETSKEPNKKSTLHADSKSTKDIRSGIGAQKKVKISNAICYETHPGNRQVPKLFNSTETVGTGKVRSCASESARPSAEKSVEVVGGPIVTNENFELSQTDSEECKHSQRCAKKVSVVCHDARVDRFNNLSPSTSLLEVSCSEVPVMTTKATSKTEIFEINRHKETQSRLYENSRSTEDMTSKEFSGKKKVKVSSAICYEQQTGNCGVPEPFVSTEVDGLNVRFSGASESVHHFAAKLEEFASELTFPAGQIDFGLSQASSGEGQNSQRAVRKVSVVCQAAVIDQMKNVTASTSMHEVSCYNAQMVSTEATTNKELLGVSKESIEMSTMALHTDSKYIENRSNQIAKGKKKIKSSTAIHYETQTVNDVPEPDVTGKWRSLASEIASSAAKPFEVVGESTIPSGQLEFQLSQADSEECRNSQRSDRKVSVVCHAAHVARPNNLPTSTNLQEVFCSEAEDMVTKATNKTEIRGNNRQTNTASQLLKDPKSSKNRRDCVSVKKRVKASSGISYETRSGNCDVPEPIVSTETNGIDKRHRGASESPCHSSAKPAEVVGESTIPTGQWECGLSQVGSEECRNSQRCTKKVSIVCHAATVDRLNNQSASSSLHEVSCSEVPVMTTKTTSKTEILGNNSQASMESTLRADSQSTAIRSIKKKKVSTAIFAETVANSSVVCDPFVSTRADETAVSYSSASERVSVSRDSAKPGEVAGFAQPSDVRVDMEAVGSRLQMNGLSRSSRHDEATSRRRVELPASAKTDSFNVKFSSN